MIPRTLVTDYSMSMCAANLYHLQHFPERTLMLARAHLSFRPVRVTLHPQPDRTCLFDACWYWRDADTWTRGPMTLDIHGQLLPHPKGTEVRVSFIKTAHHHRSRLFGLVVQMLVILSGVALLMAAFWPGPGWLMPLALALALIVAAIIEMINYRREVIQGALYMLKQASGIGAPPIVDWADFLFPGEES